MKNYGIIEKIINAHCAVGNLGTDEEIAVRVDQTLTQDATGTMAYLEFEAMKIPKVRTKLSVMYVDHNTIQDGFENADDHRYLQTIASRYGLLYSKAGNGVCHQVHLERFARPGEVLLGSDSHTPTAGGIGMMGIGVGGIDIALALGGEPFYLAAPRILRVNLHGKLPAWCSAKDVILTILQELKAKGNVGMMIEYGGDGVKTLSVPERATITNMGAELGVTTSVFPSDEQTLKFMKAQGREKQWVELHADEGAGYYRVMDIHLNKIVPMAACPHSPDNVCTVKELAGTKINQVCIGSCTNSSFRDLMITAGLLKNKKVHPDVSLVVTPGSRQVLNMIADNGALSTIITAGARVTEPCCGFCIGNSCAPQTNGVSVRTSNRNFYGRSGTKTAQVFLASPETAVISALKGVITDPRKLGTKKYPKIRLPQKFIIDDSMILKPSGELDVYRGPNIGEPPKNDPLRQTVKGVVAIKVGDDITTDHIMPAGARLKYRSNIQKYAQYVFESVDPGFSTRALENKKKNIGNIIIAGLGYGQGSSREHAAICPMYLGVKAVIAKSFERIHKANLINFGILPLVFADVKDYDSLDASDSLEIVNTMELILKDKNLTVKNKTKDTLFKVACDISGRQKQIIIAGGILNWKKK